MTATLTSDDLDNDRCPKCGLRINDTTLVAIPRAQHEALMVIQMAAATYYRGYMQDEADEEGICGKAQQDAARALRDALVALRNHPQERFAPMTDNIAALIAGLDEVFSAEFEIAHTLDMRPEDTANYKYATICRKATAALRALVQENERLRHKALMVFQMAAAAALPEDIAALIKRLQKRIDAGAPYEKHGELDRLSIAALRALAQENARRVSVELLNVERATCDRIRSDNDQLRQYILEFEVERDAIRTKTFEDCLAIIPGGTHCDPQEIADAIRALAQTDTVASQPISPSLGATALSESKD